MRVLFSRSGNLESVQGSLNVSKIVRSRFFSVYEGHPSVSKLYHADKRRNLIRYDFLINVLEKSC